MKGGPSFHRAPASVLVTLAQSPALLMGLAQAVVLEQIMEPSTGRKRAHTFNGALKVQRAARKKRNQKRHRAMCRRAGR